MVYRDKKTLNIMSKSNNFEDDYFSGKQRKARRKLIFDFYNTNINLIDKVWWSLLNIDDRLEIYEEWVDYNIHSRVNGCDVIKKNFFTDMKKRFDRTQEMRDIKIAKIIK